MIPIAFDPIYILPLPERHRFPMEKYDLLPKQLIHEGTCNKSDFFSPSPAPDQEVKAIHGPEYVDRLKAMNLSTSEIRKIGFPISSQLLERELVIAGGTIEGCLKAYDTEIAFNIAGGTHHAYRDHGEAFCLLNDQAIAAQFLLDQKLAKKILIIDLDVHQGNGTAKIFEAEDRVFTFSMHGEKNYPFKKEKSDLDIGLKDQAPDDTFLKILEETLPDLILKIRPDFIFYLSGVDVLETDQLGRLGMTIEGCKKRDQIVLGLCKKNEIPLQCSMGGGYSKEIKLIIEAHANTYRVAKGVFD